MGLFECKVKYQKIDENGKEKKVTEPYILDATSCTDAEAVMYEEMKSFVTGDFSVKQVKESRISEILIDSYGDTIYKAKVIFISLDEEKGIEKKTVTPILIFADNVGMAFKQANDLLSGTMSSYIIEGITDSKFMDYFPAK